MDTRLGGSFAPPLTDEIVARHQVTRERLAGPLADTVGRLFAGVRAWKNAPVNGGVSPRLHPVAGVIVPLSPQIRDAIDEHIPWNHELEAMERLAVDVAPDAAERNARKIDAWKVAMGEHVYRAKFGHELTADVKRLDGLNKLAQGLDLLGEDYSKHSAEAEKLAAQINTARQEWAEAIKPGKPSYAIPYPTDLEDTQGRDTAYHLLWHVKELAIGPDQGAWGREPITTDRL